MELALVSASINILHGPLPWLLTLYEFAFIGHAFEDFFLAKTVGLGVFPLPRIGKYFAFEILAEFDELPLFLKLAGSDHPSVKRSISKDEDPLWILSLMVNNFAVVDVAVAQNNKDGLIVSSRNFTVLAEIQGDAGGVDIFLDFLHQPLVLEVFEGMAARWFHLLK